MNRFSKPSALLSPTLLLAMLAFILPLPAFTTRDADEVFAAHEKAFYRERGDRAWFREHNEGRQKVSFWMRAEQLEMVLDAYERTEDPRYREMFAKLFHGFQHDHGETWERNEFNDDILWMVIACTRAYLLTGEQGYLTAARANFDLCYARAHSPDLGGGLWWKTDKQCKNACVNGPGSIAASLLAQATGEDSYRKKARNLFTWLHHQLVSADSGRVHDHLNRQGRLDPRCFTYNQGTYVGAAHLLDEPDLAERAIRYTRDELCKDGLFPPAGERGDGGGFNGIAARWIARFVKDRSREDEYGPWLRKNVEAALASRRDSDGLIWCRWPDKTPPGRRYSWGCSSAVVLLQVVNPG
ncbi:glycoside hydrolase family 76 protein [Roseibacillus ishigakijimensis]|uniref:AGE family epimerase/isomerase n=1 Tax=Roseibacillus ishigakijimensis TaxID=454146 RepID=A0A934VMR4_9BACT|nr:glycoside hydrolase family 76 protein [Roseibacillus ishigakijimensis]MBK1834230.1 AGE family epimerase/isomerase [Roseibacillus ishigakijimensis]